MTKNTLAFDFKSSRSTDKDGRLHVESSHISKAGVNPYYGYEIPGWANLGLEKTKVYKLLRDPEELKKAAPTFARVPVLNTHTHVTSDAPQKENIVGAIGSNVSFNDPYLDADMSIWEAEAIAGIDSKKIKELSCSYHYVPVMEPGEYEGEAYDGRMTEIKGNHVALVESGRAGSDVVVSDSNPFTFEVLTMKTTKLGKALHAALSAASPVLAKDSAFLALVGQATKKTFDSKGVKAKIIAMDATLNPQQLDNVIDALLEVEQDPKPSEAAPAVKDADSGEEKPKEEKDDAKDSSPEEKIKSLLAGKVDEKVIGEIIAMCKTAATDEKEDMKKDEGMKKDEVKSAMDSAIKKSKDEMREEFKSAQEAINDVRDVVGSLAMDSAAEIYGFALDHMKIDRKGVEGVPSLRALFKVAASHKGEPVIIAADSAKAAERFPNIKRFK